MKLTLDPLDLKSEFQEQTDHGIDQKIASRDVTFDKLTKEAQKAVKAVGQATFYAWDHKTYGAIYPPKKKKNNKVRGVMKNGQDIPG